MKHKYSTEYQFPSNFLWGTATAAHQIEGNNSKNDFWKWEKGNKKVPDSNRATDHYNRYKEDLTLASKYLHNNAYRLSLEWSRIQPEEETFDEKEIQHYKKVLKNIKKQNLRCILTLHHFTNPLWFAKKGAWAKSDNIVFFEKYVDLCVKNFGEFVDYWVVINEPNVYISMAYILGYWPPQKKSLFLGMKAYFNLAKAHRKSYKVIHNKFPNAKVGSSINMVYFTGSNLFEKLVSKIATWIYNFTFINLTKKNWDFIGINYYYLHFVKIINEFNIQKINLSDFLKVFHGKKKNILWPTYPRGIYHLTQRTWKKYHKEILITENGIASKDDKIRINFMLNTLQWLNRSIHNGAKIIGYCYWSLTDNIEWGMGKKAKFGLFSINYKNLKRKARGSADFYAKTCRENSVKDFSI